MINTYEVDPCLSFGYDMDQNVCDTASEDLKITKDINYPQTAAQVARMSTTHLLQDPVRAAIYRRGWEDGRLQQQRQPIPPPSPQSPNPRQSAARRPQNQTVASTASRPSFVRLRAPEPALEVFGATPFQPVKVRMEQQQARIHKNLHLKEKTVGNVSQQYRLAKRPVLPSDPEAASRSPAETMEVEELVPKSLKLKERSRIHKNLHLKEKTVGNVSQQYRLAKRPVLPSDPEAASRSPAETMEVDKLPPKSLKLEELSPSTSRE